MAKDFAKEDSDNGRKVEVSDTVIGIAVATKLSGRGEQDGSGDVDADGPGKEKETSMWSEDQHFNRMGGPTRRPG